MPPPAPQSNLRTTYFLNTPVCIHRLQALCGMLGDDLPPAILVARGRCKAAQGNFDAALTDYSDAIQMDYEAIPPCFLCYVIS